jgi:AcrR family transcriptional regulator
VTRGSSSAGARAGSPAAGRPRSSTIDGAILRAATELLVEVGVDGTTINAVARRSGVARASIYLRYPGRDALLTATIRAAIGREPIAVSGDLEQDLYRAAEQTRAILSSKPFRAVFPRLIEGLLRPRGGPGAITYAMLAPNRGLIVDEYRALAGQAGMRSDLDADLVVDLLIGGLINHLLVTGTPPTRVDAKQVVEVLLTGLRA